MHKPIAVDLYSGDRVDSFTEAKAAGIELVILKATEGTNYRDKTYLERRDAARAAGLLVAAYHFSNEYSVQVQIDNFLTFVLLDPDPNLRFVLDWEKNEATGHYMSIDAARAFLAAVDEATSHRTVIYASDSFLKERLGNVRDGEFASHPLWVAAYRDSAAPPVPQASWTSPILWQYTGDGVGGYPRTIAGIPGNSEGKIDLNVAPDMTAEQFRSLWLADLQSPNHRHDWSWIQGQLIAKGYDLGPTGADGDPGARTEAAIAAYLESH